MKMMAYIAELQSMEGKLVILGNLEIALTMME